MVTEHTLIKFGFSKDDDNLKLKEVFKNKAMISKIHIDIYPENPLVNSSKSFMLLLRTIEERVMVENDGERIVLKRTIDRFETHFMNVLFSRITECYYKFYNGCLEFVLNIQNIYYKITVFN